MLILFILGKLFDKFYACPILHHKLEPLSTHEWNYYCPVYDPCILSMYTNACHQTALGTVECTRGRCVRTSSNHDSFNNSNSSGILFLRTVNNMFFKKEKVLVNGEL